MTARERALEIAEEVRLLDDENRLPELHDAAILKISPMFPDTPEGELMLAVIAQAIDDANMRDGGEDCVSAIKYLTGEMLHAKICGVNPEWIRSVLKNIGILTPIQAACGYGLTGTRVDWRAMRARSVRATLDFLSKKDRTEAEQSEMDDLVLELQSYEKTH